VKKAAQGELEIAWNFSWVFYFLVAATDSTPVSSSSQQMINMENWALINKTF